MRQPISSHSTVTLSPLHCACFLAGAASHSIAMDLGFWPPPPASPRRTTANPLRARKHGAVGGEDRTGRADSCAFTTYSALAVPRMRRYTLLDNAKGSRSETVAKRAPKVAQGHATRRCGKAGVSEAKTRYDPGIHAEM